MNERVIKYSKYHHKNNVLYLMRRDKRIYDNYCIEWAYRMSDRTRGRLYIAIELAKLKLNERQRTFVIEGLQEVEEICRWYNLYFDLIDDLEKHVSSRNIDCIVMDFSPLRECQQYQCEVKKMCEKYRMPLYVCDANNMVPCRLLSTYKKSGKAVKMTLFTFWPEYLDDFKPLKVHKFNRKKETRRQVNEFPEKQANNVFRGGYTSGMAMVEEFFETRFSKYHKYRNNPEVDAQSKLDPWISLGQISSQRVIFMAVKRFSHSSENLWTFINEVFVWKETADHFCMHEENYDNIRGALAWARNTLKSHSTDEREQVYDLKTLVNGKTHSKLWNAAQRQLLSTGKMHLYCRMFWAKQLLRWIRKPEEAIKIGCYLNDTFSMDGNTANGYLAIMWAMCGTMDQGFKDRPITGKIRPMNEFRAPKYIYKWTET